MQPEYKNKRVLYTLNELTAVFFQKYSVSSITLSAKEKNEYFGYIKDKKFNEKLEAKITEKAWKEIPLNFPEVKLGNYSFTGDTFTAIITINNKVTEENTKKLLPRIIASFKSRSTILLNQFHGKHGRVFWENTYEEKTIRNLKELHEVLNPDS